MKPWSLSLGALLLLGGSPAMANDSVLKETGNPAQWAAQQGDYANTRYSTLDQINKDNVDDLEVAWTFPVTGTVIFNPLIVDNVLYLHASNNTLAAVDPATGKELWRKQMSGTFGARGMNYWESPDRTDRRIFFLAGGIKIVYDLLLYQAFASTQQDERQQTTAD